MIDDEDGITSDIDGGITGEFREDVNTGRPKGPVAGEPRSTQEIMKGLGPITPADQRCTPGRSRPVGRRAVLRAGALAAAAALFGADVARRRSADRAGDEVDRLLVDYAKHGSTPEIRRYLVEHGVPGARVADIRRRASSEPGRDAWERLAAAVIGGTIVSPEWIQAMRTERAQAGLGDTPVEFDGAAVAWSQVQLALAYDQDENAPLFSGDPLGARRDPKRQEFLRAGIDGYVALRVAFGLPEKRESLEGLLDLQAVLASRRQQAQETTTTLER